MSDGRTTGSPSAAGVRALVLGAGYVGLVTAAGIGGLGNDVVLVEKQPERLAVLRGGRIHVHEPGVQERLDPLLRSGRLRIAGSAKFADPEVVFVCVGTPMSDTGAADLTQVEAALNDARPLIEAGAAVVLRSTMPPGTSRMLLDRTRMPSDRFFSAPEFFRQGTALEDFLHPTRIVIGRTEQADERLLTLIKVIFAPLEAPRLVVSLEEAELIKNGSNAFLALKLSFANEMALLAESYAADIGPVIAGIGLDPRIGAQQMRPGFGFGGSCLPKELQAVAQAGLRRGLDMHVTLAAAEANSAHQARFADRIEARVGGADGRTVALLGLAFKGGTDDVRSSPAMRIGRLLLDRGAIVRGLDPAAARNAKRELPGLVLCDDPEELLVDADACAVTTDWPEFRAFDWPILRPLMRRPIVIDGRRLLDPAAMFAAGYAYERVGSPPGPG